MKNCVASPKCGKNFVTLWIKKTKLLKVLFHVKIVNLYWCMVVTKLVTLTLTKHACVVTSSSRKTLRSYFKKSKVKLASADDKNRLPRNVYNTYDLRRFNFVAGRGFARLAQKFINIGAKCVKLTLKIFTWSHNNITITKISSCRIKGKTNTAAILTAIASRILKANLSKTGGVYNIR